MVNAFQTVFPVCLALLPPSLLSPSSLSAFPLRFRVGLHIVRTCAGDRAVRPDPTKLTVIYAGHIGLHTCMCVCVQLSSVGVCVCGCILFALSISLAPWVTVGLGVFSPASRFKFITQNILQFSDR